MSLLAFILLICFLGVNSVQVRPCTDNSARCIGKFLAKNSRCSTSRTGLVPLDPLQLDVVPVLSPFFNFTADWVNVEFNHLNDSKIIDFFYNDKSKRLVLVNLFPKIQIKGTANVHVYTPGAETIEIQSNYTIIYESVTLTTEFKNYKNISLSTSTAVSYFPTLPTYLYENGMDQAAAKYPHVAFLIDQMVANPAVLNAEAFLTRSPIISRAVVNNQLCYFGYH